MALPTDSINPRVFEIQVELLNTYDSLVVAMDSVRNIGLESNLVAEGVAEIAIWYAVESIDPPARITTLNDARNVALHAAKAAAEAALRSGQDRRGAVEASYRSVYQGLEEDSHCHCIRVCKYRCADDGKSVRIDPTLVQLRSIGAGPFENNDTRATATPLVSL